MTVIAKPFAKAKRAVLRALRARSIARVEIEYDGEGDSGQIGGIHAYDAKNGPVGIDRPVKLALRNGQKPIRYGSFTEALDDFAWTVLEELHYGFYNGDGGFGTIAIDAVKGTVTIDHNDRVSDVLNTETDV
jgi:hypothetical protein